MVELSTLTKQHVTTLFGSSDWAEAERLLASECGENLPLVNSPTPSGLERLRFAAIRVSGGVFLESAMQSSWRSQTGATSSLQVTAARVRLGARVTRIWQSAARPACPKWLRRG